MFFFKKEPKNFCSPSGVCGTAATTSMGIKVFLLLFVHKKKSFLAFP
jgi:hypothetical protein